MFFIPIVTVAVIVIAIVAAVRHPDPLKRALRLRRAGFAWMALFALLFGAFIVGETFVDPGGWKAVGLVSAWAVPLAGLAVLAWYRPDRATYVFAVLTAAVIGASIWFAVNPRGWRSFENQHGPIRVIITFVLVAPIALLGLKRTASAGFLLLVAGVVPVAVSGLGGFPGLTSLSVASSAPVITGILYLVSARIAGRPAAPESARAVTATDTCGPGSTGPESPTLP